MDDKKDNITEDVLLPSTVVSANLLDIKERIRAKIAADLEDDFDYDEDIDDYDDDFEEEIEYEDEQDDYYGDYSDLGEGIKELLEEYSGTEADKKTDADENETAGKNSADYRSAEKYTEEKSNKEKNIKEKSFVDESSEEEYSEEESSEEKNSGSEKKAGEKIFRPEKRFVIAIIIGIIFILFIIVEPTLKNFDGGFSLFDKEEEETTEAEIIEEGPGLITKDKLFEMVGITQADFPDVDFDQFIKTYSLTEENVNNFNIRSLAYDFGRSSEGRGYEYLFSGEQELHSGDLTKDMIRLVSYRTKDNNLSSVMIDFKAHKKYFSSEDFLFSDIDSAKASDFGETKCNELLKELESNKFFEWSSTIEDSDNKNSNIFVAVVEYSDGTVWRVAYSGSLSSITPENFSEVEKLLYE